METIDLTLISFYNKIQFFFSSIIFDGQKLTHFYILIKMKLSRGISNLSPIITFVAENTRFNNNIPKKNYT